MQTPTTLCTGTMRAAFGMFVLLSTLAAQQQNEHPLDGAANAATAQLRDALRATATAGATAFASEWLWPNSTATLTRPGAEPQEPKPVHVQGVFTPDALTAVLDDGASVCQVGRQCALRRSGQAWQLVSVATIGMRGKHAVPDPQLLLLALAAGEFAVVDRSIGERGGRAVEWVAITLPREQIDALVSAGALSEPNPVTAPLKAMLAAGRIDAKDVPADIVDVAVELDVATRLVRRLRVRALSSSTAAAQVLRKVGRAAAAERPPEDTPVEPAADPASETPTEFREGLPVRTTTGLQERWLEFRLSDPGKAEPPELDAELKALLGR